MVKIGCLVLAYGHRDDHGSLGFAAKDARDPRPNLTRIIVVGIEKNQHYTIIANANALHSDCTAQLLIQHLGPGKTIRMRKERRAHGGCQGIRQRRRTRQAAKSPGEAQATLDPGVSEWGNPSGVGRRPESCGGEVGDVKHLSSRT